MDVKDVVIVAANLHKLVNTPIEGASSHTSPCANGSYGPKSVVFALVSIYSHYLHVIVPLSQLFD